jgi:spore coat protein CotH
MNRLTNLIMACVAGGLAMAAGCSRQQSQPAAPAVEQAGPTTPSVPREKLDRQRVARDGKRPQSLNPQSTAAPGPDNASRQELDLPDRQSGTTELESDPQPRLGTSTTSAGNLARSTASYQGRGSKKQDADALFDRPSLLRIQIEIPPAGISALRGSRSDNHSNRPVAQATVREGGIIYTNVAIHLKGSVGSFRSVDGKPALTLKFDKFVPNQSFHGLHKISLNNSVQDGTFLSEKIARELFIAAGVPAPRASHATVELNGRNLGLYVLLEGANKQFLKRYFSTPSGNLYDGGFCRDINGRLSVNCGEDPKNHADLNALRAAVRAGSYAGLEKVLDMDRFISMLALEWMLCHWDGYTQNRNNWRIFDDLESRRMVFIPHGMDQLLGKGRSAGKITIWPGNVQGEVSRLVLSSPEGRKRYRDRVADLYTNLFNVDRVAAHIDEIATGVSAGLAQTDPQAGRSFQKGANAFKQRFIRRADALRPLFGEPLHPTIFGSDGVLKLSGWKESPIQSGQPLLSETRDASGTSILSINAGQSASSGSWRTRIVLGPGSYQFEGRLRLNGVMVPEGDRRAGAGLRVSKGVMPKKLTGSCDWREYQYPFTISQEADVELICELKATSGEAWFDAQSLRLVRTP